MKKAMVVAPQSEPADIAIQVIESGGNAFDAAVAGAFAQGIVDFQRSGVGGFGAATLYVAETGKTETISFFGRAGGKARPDMWQSISEGPAQDGFGYLMKGKVNDVGYQSITLPGTVAGLSEIHGRYGKLPWKELLSAPAALAREGFLIVSQMHDFWRRPGLFGRVSAGDRLGLSDEGRRIFFKDGEPPKGGSIVKMPDLADTYDRLAKWGPDDFYRGALAREMVADWEKNGALITADDLASYKCLWEAPLRGRFKHYEVESTPLPGGGVALLQALALVEMTGLLELPHNSPEYVDRLAHIFAAIQNDRGNAQSDPAFGGPAPEALLSKTHLNRLLDSRGLSASEESPDTTVLAVTDQAGNAIVLCHSLGYGSGVFTPGLGFMYNNCMSGFDPTPGTANSIAPGKARSTAIAQTLVKENGKPKLILGSPGGSRITAGIAQAMINYLHFGCDLQDAVCRPRIDAYQNTLLLEPRMPFTLQKALAERWEVKRSVMPFGLIGRIYALAFEDGPKPGYDPGEPATVRESY